MPEGVVVAVELLSANRGALFKLFDMYCDTVADETPTFSACTAWTSACPLPVCWDCCTIEFPSMAPNAPASMTLAWLVRNC
jgi:hypothetical protein